MSVKYQQNSIEATFIKVASFYTKNKVDFFI